MRYLTPQQVLVIHDLAIKRYGGSSGLRDIGLLESAIYTPQASFGGRDLYPSIFEKGAALLQSLLKNHPFVEGNKRTALSSAAIFLKLNGYSLINRHKEEVEVAIKVDKQNLDVEEISNWLKSHSKKA